jgi:hypothetical protein
MSDPRKIVGLSISTVSTEPLRGIVEIDSFDSTVTFELSEDTALRICTYLERFLTQRSTRDHGTQCDRSASSPQDRLSCPFTS